MEQALRWKFGYVLCQLLDYFERRPPVVEPMINLGDTCNSPQPTPTLVIPLSLPFISPTATPDFHFYNLVLDPFLQLYYFHKLRPPDVLFLGPMSFQRAYFFFRGRPPEGLGSQLLLPTEYPGFFSHVVFARVSPSPPRPNLVLIKAFPGGCVWGKQVDPKGLGGPLALMASSPSYNRSLFYTILHPNLSSV